LVYIHTEVLVFHHSNHIQTISINQK